MGNPFKPTAGATPPILIARDEIIESFAESIEDGPGAPGLLSLFTGPRGIGKTVVLTEVENEARKAGWMVISETATQNLIRRIDSQATELKNEIGKTGSGRQVTSVTVGPFSIDSNPPPIKAPHWRVTITDLLRTLESNRTGLLITVDEIHAIRRDELAELATVVQHLIREDLPIGMALAGLPKAVYDLLNEGVTTFLRRAERYDLASTSIDEVRQAFAETFSDSGVTVDEDNLDTLSEATQGYPFLIQLVGYHVWRLAKKGGGKVTGEIAREGIEAARKRMGANVLEAAYSDLSDIDRTFLLLMAQDDGPSKTRDIAERLNVTKGYMQMYRRRLLDSGVIQVAGHGEIDFAVPQFREFLREQAAYRFQLRLP